jgi:hypothetical protein
MHAIHYLFLGFSTKPMRTCESCGRVRFYSLNFLFSKTVCNECYLKMKEKQKKG